MLNEISGRDTIETAGDSTGREVQRHAEHEGGEADILEQIISKLNQQMEKMQADSKGVRAAQETIVKYIR